MSKAHFPGGFLLGYAACIAMHRQLTRCLEGKRTSPPLFYGLPRRLRELQSKPPALFRFNRGCAISRVMLAIGAMGGMMRATSRLHALCFPELAHICSVLPHHAYRHAQSTCTCGFYIAGSDVSLLSVILSTTEPARYA